MTDANSHHHTETISSVPSQWGSQVTLVGCKQCDWSYLLPAGAEEQRCPHCYADALIPLTTDSEGLPHAETSEAYLPFQLSDEQVEQAVERFAKRVPLAPPDLKPTNLRQRLQAVYLPRWLVDADVQATWQAEAGFDYEVVSHEERFDGNHKRWRTREITETRIRWDPRAGRLDRRYHNVVAPALDEDADIRRQLGSFDIKKARSFQSQVLDQALVRLPNRSIDDAWPDALPNFYRTASVECQQASGAEHLREFQWWPQFSGRDWTQLLLPVYSTSYLDDDAIPRPVLIHGQTGRVSGVRRASQKRARRLAIILVTLAFVFLVLGTGLAAIATWADGGTFQTLSVLGLVAGMLFGVGAIIPPAIAWSFNRSQRQQDQVFD